MKTTIMDLFNNALAVFMQFYSSLELTLVNPFLIKQMPGRKSDAKDAQWIAELLYKGMIRSSFVPPPLIQELRVYSRKYSKLQQQVTRVLVGMDNILIMCGIRASSCLSRITTKSYMLIVDALIKGYTKPDYLVSLVYGNTKSIHKTGQRFAVIQRFLYFVGKFEFGISK